MRPVSGTIVQRHALLPILALALLGCKKEEKAEDAASHPEVAATTVVITPQAFTETLGAIGTVVSRAGHSATLSAPAAGRVARILVTSGQSVRAGQTLIELDQAPFQASLESAQAALAALPGPEIRNVRVIPSGGNGVVFGYNSKHGRERVVRFLRRTPS